MSMTDPIADFLTRIRNAFRTEKRWVDIPSSNLKKRIAYVLKEENILKIFSLLMMVIFKQLEFFLNMIIMVFLLLKVLKDVVGLDNVYMLVVRIYLEFSMDWVFQYFPLQKV